MKFSLVFTFLLFFYQMCASDRPLLVFFKEGLCEAEQQIVQDFEFSKIQEIARFETIDCGPFSLEDKCRMKEKYHLQDLPRLVLFDQRGIEIARYGFRGEKPEKLAMKVKEIVQGLKDLEMAVSRLEGLSCSLSFLEELYQKALSLKQEETALAFLEKGIERNHLFFLLEKYRLLSEKGQDAKEIREKIFAIDPQNEKEGQFSLALIDFQTLSTHCPSREAVRPLEDYLARFGETDIKNRWRLEMMIAQFYLNYDEWTTSLKHAEIAMHEAPCELKEEIGKCCQYIKSQLASPLAECTK